MEEEIVGGVEYGDAKVGLSSAKRGFERFVMRLWPKKVPKKVPVAGEEWWLKNDSPWPKPNQTPVKILDVKDGWVRYDMQGLCFRDERMEMSSFLYCYRFHPDA